jgi:hypothetical protein
MRNRDTLTTRLAESLLRTVKIEGMFHRILEETRLLNAAIKQTRRVS